MGSIWHCGCARNGNGIFLIDHPYRMNTLIANFKANPVDLETARHLFDSIAEAARTNPGVEVVVCPPAVFLAGLSEKTAGAANNLMLGAQDVFWQNHGPYTGAITPDMLNALGVTHVLIGHSERRAIGETDEMVNKKMLAVLTAGLTPVYLVGEPERDEGAKRDILIDQMTNGLKGIAWSSASRIRFVYEPAWAISTTSGGEAETPDGAAESAELLRSILVRIYPEAPSDKTRFLYGGSVNAQNLSAFLAKDIFCGAVVGGASLRSDEFARMISITASNPDHDA